MSMAGTCIFCKIANKEMSADVVHEDNGLTAFNDINPQAPVHVIIIPKKHVQRISDINEADKSLVGALFLAAKKIAKDKDIESSGYRLIINCGENAGQAVQHLHLHLLGGRKFSWPPG